MTSCTGSARGGFGGFWRKSVSWVLRSEEEAWLSQARSGLVAGVAHDVGWADGKVIIERLCISLPYVETFNSKVIKGFVPDLRSRYVFFVFRDSYVLCIYVRNILCTFRISISWVWYIASMLHWVFFKSLERFVYLFVSFIFHQWSARTIKSTGWHILFLLFINTRHDLVKIRWSVGISKPQRLADGFVFVCIPFGSMVKFESLAYFPANHLSQPIVHTLVFLCYQLIAFVYNGINRLNSLSTQYLLAIPLRVLLYVIFCILVLTLGFSLKPE